MNKKMEILLDKCLYDRASEQDALRHSMRRLSRGFGIVVDRASLS